MKKVIGIIVSIIWVSIFTLTIIGLFAFTPVSFQSIVALIMIIFYFYFGFNKAITYKHGALK